MRDKKKNSIIFVLSILLTVFLGASIISLNVPQKTYGYQNDGYVYLSDLYPSEKNVVFYDNVAINMDYPNGNPFSWTENGISLLVGGSRSKFSKGVSIQSIGSATYDIENMNATRFTAKVGVNVNGGTCVFVVKVDGTVKFTSNLLNYNSNAEDVDVDIPNGAKKLTIEVQDGGDNADNDHGVFAEPRLYCSFADLTDAVPTNVVNGYNPVTFNETKSLPHLIGQGTDGVYVTKPLFNKTINAHANSTVEYSIEGTNAKKFTTSFGINGNTSGGNGVVFKVLIDDNEKASKTVLSQEQFGFFNIDIPAGAKKITLVASDNGNLDYDHAIWANPRIYNYNADFVDKLEVETVEKIVKPNETFGVDVKFLDVFGVELDDSSYNYVMESSDSSIVKINGNGTATALKGGTVNLTASATIDSKKYSVTKEIIVVGEENAIVLKSPNGKSEIQIAHSTISGKLYYQLFQDGDRAVNLSEIGQSTSIGDFSEGLKFVSLSKIQEINETYQTFGGKKDYYTDHCFTQSITLSKGGVLFTVEARAYDDGGAFRFIVTPTNANEYTLFKVGSSYGEKTTLSVPEDSVTWSTIMPDTTGKCSPHEHFGEEMTMRYFDSMRVVPFMYKTPSGTYVYVTEAGMNGQYAGVVLRSIDKTSMRFSVSNQQQADISVCGKYTSSWRTFATGTLQMVYATEIIENVSDPCKIEDTSWIKPGVSSWSWMEGVNNYWSQGGSTNPNLNAFDIQQGLQRDPDAIKKYIDLSASMGWEYFCMDDGWQPYISLEEAKSRGYTINKWSNFEYYYDGFFDWTQEVCDYANSKGVGLIAWIHTGIMDTEEKMDRLFTDLSNFGIKGIKVDFFDSEEQWIIELWQLIYRKAAEYKLLVNVHGANKPTGERRTWPNVINREAIYGEEMNKTLSSNMVIQAVLRSVCGPADFTPYFNPVASSDIWMSGQIALPIIYESGITCFASKASDYDKLTTEMRFFYTDFPEAWDQSIFLSGEVGKNVSIARKGRDVERWYVAGLTVDARTDVIDCSFLDENKNYNAYIYYGGDQLTSLEYDIKSVTSESKISVSAIKNGGYAILIAPTQYSEGYNIVYTGTDYAKYKLNKYIIRADGLNSSLYVESDFSALTTLLQEAKALYNSSNVTSVQLEAKACELKQFMEKLSKVGDAEQLQEKLVEARLVEEDGYSEESFAVLDAIIKEIEALNFSNLTQSEIDGCLESLTDAMDNLIKVFKVSVIKSDGGTVKGITDGNSYEYGQNLSITITANANYKITSIKLNGNPVSVTNESEMTITHQVTGTVTLQVTYASTKVQVTVGNVDSTEGTVTGIENGSYEIGKTFNVTISANTGYVIKRVTWNGNEQEITSNKTLTLTLTVNAKSNLSVTFEKEYFKGTLKNDSSYGTVEGISDGSNYEYGAQLCITITANTSYKIKSITLNGTPVSVTDVKEMTIEHTVTGAVTLEVKYEADIKTVTVTVNNNNSQGTISGVTSKSYNEGTKLSITITAKDGYEIKSIKFGSKSINISNPARTTFSETLTDDVTITVTYTKATVDEEPSGGCGSSIGRVSTIVLSLLALASASVLVFKKKEN